MFFTGLTGKQPFNISMSWLRVPPIVSWFQWKAPMRKAGHVPVKKSVLLLQKNGRKLSESLLLRFKGKKKDVICFPSSFVQKNLPPIMEMIANQPGVCVEFLPS